jgi:lysosomal acid lipase/cholesteryl ester hydrolase
MFSALTENSGDLQHKLSVYVALAPVANLKQNNSDLLHQAAQYWRQLEVSAQTLGVYELKDPTFDKAMVDFCRVFGDLCDGIKSFLHMEGSPYNVDASEEVQDYRYSSGASLGQLAHYGQLADNGLFRKYDYGDNDLNIQHYGSPTPPLLSLARIHTTPVGMFVGKQDPYADLADVHSFKSKLSTLAFYQEYSGMDHYSFGIGKNMSYMQDVIALLKQTGSVPAEAVE